MAINPNIQTTGKDRRLYTWFVALIPIIVLAGFGRTYYLKAFFGNPPLPGLLVHIHGLVMTSWVVLFMAQVSLVATGRIRTHQRLGVLGAILAIVIVVVGMLTGIAGAARGATPGPPALSFLIIPLGDMMIFAILIGTALYFRRRRLDIHKRLMLLAAVNLLAPAIARIPLAFIANGGALAFFGLTDLCILACVGFDTIKNRRLHPAFLWGTLFVIAAQPLRLMLAGTDLWLQFAAALVGLWK